MDNSPLRRLPPEIRRQIYEDSHELGVVYLNPILSRNLGDEPTEWCMTVQKGNKSVEARSNLLPLIRSCKQVFLEAQPLVKWPIAAQTYSINALNCGGFHTWLEKLELHHPMFYHDIEIRFSSLCYIHNNNGLRAAAALVQRFKTVAKCFETEHQKVTLVLPGIGIPMTQKMRNRATLPPNQSVDIRVSGPAYIRGDVIAFVTRWGRLFRVAAGVHAGIAVGVSVPLCGDELGPLSRELCLFPNGLIEVVESDLE